jgi:threonine dehydrogenase-like Zn-dependent dehydrogenase
MGEVVETGPECTRLKKGDRVVVPFTIACGGCFFCVRGLWSACDNTNPNASIAETLYEYTGSALFGYSHIYGGYAGGQAEYVRVPHAQIGPIQVPDALSDEQVLFLSDIFPTGWMAAENCEIQKGDTVAIWGAGPVGQFAIRSAFLLGAGRVFAIDDAPERLALAEKGGATPIDRSREKVLETLKEETGGRGPDACIDAVGMEAHGHGLQYAYDRVKQSLRLETDRPGALREAIQACRKGGHVSVPGVYGGVIDKINFGAAFAKGVTMKMGQTHVHRYLKPLLDRIEKEEIDPSFVISHRMSLDDAPEAYAMFRNHEDGCTKVVLKP